MGADEDLCGTHPWGPWEDGNLTLCFQDVVLGGVFFAFIALFGSYRLIEIRRSFPLRFDLPTTWVFVAKFLVCLAVAGIAVSRTFITLFIDSAEPYELLSDGMIAAGWIYASAIYMVEYSRGLPNNWVLRGWWLLAFIFGAVRLQTVVVLIEDYGWEWDYNVFFVDFGLYTVISILGLWFHEVPVTAQFERLSQDEAEKLPLAYKSLLHKGEERFIDGGGPCPEDSANILSRFTFWWFDDLLYFGFDHALAMEDLHELCKQDQSPVIAAAYEAAWDKQLQRQKPSLARALFASFGWQFAFAGVYKLINDVAVFGGPLLLSAIVAFIQDNEDPMWYGLLLAALMLLSSAVQSIASHQYFHIGFRVGMKIRAALVMAVYRKAFKMSGAARQQSTVGEIVNHMSLDAQRLMDLVPYLHMVWSALFQIGVSLGLLWRVVGVSTLGGLAVMILLIPVNAVLARWLGSIQKEMMKHKDARNKIVNEVLQGIRVIKFFAWEDSFREKVGGVRNAEMATLRKSAYLRAVSSFFWTVTPLLVSVVTFTMYSLLDNTLDAATAFTALSLFNVLRFPLNMLPQVISSLVEANVSVKRMQKYLLAEEVDPFAVERKPRSEDAQATREYTKKSKRKSRKSARSGDAPVAIEIRDGEFQWDQKTAEPTLKDINITIREGELVAVVGAVGSGKSSLLAALLGDIKKNRGKVTVRGDVALVTQQAWIQNATLKDNILYGSEYDHERYEEVVRCCELAPDIAMLPAGDMTEIGEKGINLSGGQKQRVSIARAVYANRDVYLLDDPLSAVDEHVGKAIFDNCVAGELDGKTRVLVTHQLQFLHQADQIIVLKDGRIAEMGSYADLMQDGKEFASLIKTHVKDSKAKDNAEEEEADEEEEATGKDKKAKGEDKEKEEKKKDKMMSVEEREEGSVSWRVYWEYIVALGGIVLVSLILAAYISDQGSSIMSNWWLSYWSDNESKNSVWFYLGIYAAIGGGNTLFVLIRSILFAYGGLNSAKSLHEKLLHRILRAPMAFFDTTPVGRILNRFSKDIYVIDEMLPRTMGFFLMMFFGSVGIMVVIAMVTPFFLCAFIPLGFVYHYMQQYYIRSSRELKRLDSISRSPIYAHFSETLAGISTIRSYDQEERFVTENQRKLDENQKAYFASVVANRWLGIRVEFIGTCVVSLAALFAVLERDNIDPGMAGLSLTYALNITGVLNWVVRMSTEAETQLVSVERVIQYMKVETEAPAVVLETLPPRSWPEKGAIDFKNVKLRYRPELDLVLKGINVSIKPKEKVGVVGRTGAGKSSLMLALFRLVEAAEGVVEIDGVNIATLGLDTLRSRLSIIPQDPTLFTGTIRSNLDPFEKYTDEEIWYALEKVHLKEAVQAMGGIDSAVSEFGENLSVGQRQLMCLGRALLRRAKILVMDEATAAVDYETDRLIQETIREEFVDVTVLTIAHRIQTIIDYDRVLVLDKGLVVEFENPTQLLQNPGSVFYSMVHASGTTEH